MKTHYLFIVILVFIFSCNKKEEPFYGEISGTVYDSLSMSVIQFGKIVLVENVNPNFVIDSTNTNEVGTFYLSKAKPFIDYLLIYKKENYFSKTISLKLNPGEQIVRAAYLLKPNIIITQPTKVTHWTVGTTDTIRWNDNFPGNVRIDLYKAGVFVQMIADNTPANTAYIWTIPAEIESSRPDYSINISSVIQPDININSDNFALETTVNDIDGNTYNTVTIGAQVWLRENLKVTHYTDGTDIPLVTNFAAWDTLTKGAYCWYENDYQTFGVTYGALYNWYLVNTGKLCPAGWHVPTDAEWTILTDFLGGNYVAGGKLKEAGFSHWNPPNLFATNETVFTALPGGFRGHDAVFYDIGNGYWWSSTEYDASLAWGRFMYYEGGDVASIYGRKQNGNSVRCLRDY